MPELRRFAPNVPIVLVGTKLGKLAENRKYCDFVYAHSSYLHQGSSLTDFMNLVCILDLREDRGFLADHMGSNIITSNEVCILYISFVQ